MHYAQPSHSCHTPEDANSGTGARWRPKLAVRGKHREEHTLRRLDGRMRIRDTDIEILRAVLMLAVLPATTIEQLGAGLGHAEFAPGQTVFAQGDAGDRVGVLQRPAFLTAVTGHPMSATAGREVVALFAKPDDAKEVSRSTP